MKYKYLTAILGIILLTTLCATAISAQKKAKKIPKEINDLVGAYSGSWTSYALSPDGQVVKQAVWTDVLRAESPVVEKTRTFVVTLDEMTFEGGRIPPMKISGKEGYVLNKNGSIGDYFIETNSQTYRLQKLGNNVWVYSIPASSQELTRIGVPNPISAQHVLIKVVTFDQGVETHNISRLTIVKWKDASGTERTKQFVSLQGQHKRQT